MLLKKFDGAATLASVDVTADRKELTM